MEQPLKSPPPPAVADAVAGMIGEIKKVIVGQGQVVEEILIALFSEGHALLIGVPGLAKTLLVRTIADILDLSFNRIQFTPDLMPADITGADILEEREHRGREFRFLKGPIFSHLILADEINRTPPKTQAALLQAMQEYQVTSGGRTFALERPFFVLATQNPIEQEGTYPLPEAQLDRFMLNVNIDYPPMDDEVAIVKATTASAPPKPRPVLTREQILAIQRTVRSVPAADHVIRHAVSLVSNTRPGNVDAPDFIKEWVSWGAGPRATQHLVLGAKARALLKGRNAVSIEDVRTLIFPALRHRIIPNFSAEAEGIRPDRIIERLLERIQPEKGKL